MSALNTQCPPESMLSDFGLGKLGDAQAETVSRHLETCADCRQVVANLSGDSFVNRLRKAPGGGASPDRIDRTFVAGESASNASSNAETPWGGAPRPTRDASSPGKPAPQAVSGPPELAELPDYELIKELGRGGMGVVYLAKNRMMDRPEVLKVVSKSLLDKPDSLERFQQEIRSAAKLSHPNIVAAHAVLRPGDMLVFAMEYVDGNDLSQVVKRRGPLPVLNAAFYAHQVALGLQHAHEKGMVHRDIKPNNLMLAVEGKKHVVKILDFGLAKATSEKGAETGLTKSGQMLGTPDYLAPEQTLNAQVADIRADIYSLGCTLYYLLAGRAPFQAQSLYELLEAHQKRDPRPLNLVRPDVPVELAAIVGKMLAKDPAKRYQTPLEVARALTPFFKPGPSAATANLPPKADAEQSHVSVASAPADGQVTDASSATSEPSGAIEHAPAPVPLPAAPMPIPVERSPSESVISVDTTRQASPQRQEWRSWWRSLPPWQRYAATAVGAAALALLLGVVLLVHTQNGTVEIALSDPQAKVTVSVDGDLVDIAGLDDPLSLEVGEHELKVTGKGYETCTKKFTVTKGKNSPLTVTLVPRVATPSRPTPPLVKPLESAVGPYGLGSIPLEHTAAARACQFSPDGKLLATGGEDGVIKLWDVETGKEQATLAIREAVEQIAFSPDGKVLVCWMPRGNPRNPARWAPKFWDIATRRELADLPFPCPSLGPMAFSPDGNMVATIGTNQIIELWDFSTGKSLGSLTGHATAIDCLAFSPDGASLASGSEDMVIKLWSLTVKQEVLSLPIEAQQLFGTHVIRFATDAKRLLIGAGSDMTVYDLAGSQVLWHKHLNLWGTWSLALTASDKRLVVAGGGDPSHFIVVDLMTGQSLRTVAAWRAFRDGNRGAEALAVSPDGRTLASAGPDHTVKLWDTTTWEERTTGIATPASAPAAPRNDHEREVAEWVLSQGGRVVVKGVADEISKAAKLPAGRISLEKVNLSQVRVANEDLRRFRGLPDLAGLYLFQSSIGDEGILNLTDLPNLRELSIDDLVDPKTAAHLAAFQELEKLAVNIGDDVLSQLNALPKLSTLDVRGDLMTNAGLKDIKDFESLHWLLVHSRRIDDDGLANLTSDSLEILVLWGTSVRGNGLSNLQRLPKLTTLWLDGLPIDDDALRGLRGLSMLHNLQVDNTLITDKGLEILAKISLPGLVSIGLAGTQITDRGLAHLKRLPQLKSLGLNRTKVTQQGIDSLRAALPDCQINWP